MREDGSFHAINHRSALISPTISKNRNSKIASSAISEYTVFLLFNSKIEIK